jgi:hypothetical protein
MTFINLGTIKTVPNTGLAKVAVPFSALSLVMKIATFAKPETVMAHFSLGLFDTFFKFEYDNVRN